VLKGIIFQRVLSTSRRDLPFIIMVIKHAEQKTKVKWQKSNVSRSNLMEVKTTETRTCAKSMKTVVLLLTR
jgi:hypothetical protein